MKIVQVVHGFPPEVVGGTERYVLALTEGLRDRGHELFVYSGSLEWMEDFTVEAVEREGFELVTVHRNDLYFDRWDKAYNPLVEENFRAFLESRKPDLVHVHHWVRLTSNLAAIASECRIPAVITLHDLYITCPRFFRMKSDGSYCVHPISPDNCLHSVERWLFQRDAEIRGALVSFMADGQAEMRSANRVIAPSASHARTVTERLGMPELDIRVLPHGTLTELQPAPVPPKGQKLKIVCFSHLYPYKGGKQLLDALVRMKRRGEAELHFFGAEVIPEFARELKELAKGLDVTFHGPYKPTDLERFPMDVVVIPTLLAESYSFILDEASALRVPIVAFDSGALKERAAAPSAILCRKGDVQGLADALDRLAGDRDLLAKMRAAQPVPVLTMAEHLKRLEGLYQEAVKEGPKPAGGRRKIEHLKEQWERREYGFKELVRSEQWEQLVASLRKRIVELEIELSKRPPARNPE